METLQDIRRPIEVELKQYRMLFEETLQSNNPILHLALSHLLQRQGKMMRPILVFLAAKMVGKVNERVLHAAVSLELLHTASLVHDDVVDESDRRRGQRSVNALLDNKAAVLVGDFLLSKALYHAAQTGSNRVVTWVSELGQILSDGELQQLANTDSKEFSEDVYYEIIEKKTASLFSCCGRIGAFLAGADDESVLIMSNFGKYVGLCFQLRDDIFDYDQINEAGKPTGNDMREGKLTLPVLHALLTSEENLQRDSALKVRAGEASEEEMAGLVTFAFNQGGIAYATKAMHDYCDKALGLLNKNRDSDIAESLRSYVRFVANRSL